VFVPYIPLLDLHLLAHRRLDHSFVLAPGFDVVQFNNDLRRPSSRSHSLALVALCSRPAVASQYLVELVRIFSTRDL
jgi:hypothetical protein